MGLYDGAGCGERSGFTTTALDSEKRAAEVLAYEVVNALGSYCAPKSLGLFSLHCNYAST